jgi:hypothetical protein
MAQYGLIRIKLDPHGRIEHARLRELDPAGKRWISDAMEMPANQLARLIGTGHQVHSLFQPSAKHPYPRYGAKLRVKTFAGGIFGVELEKETEGKTLDDLAKIE